MYTTLCRWTTHWLDIALFRFAHYVCIALFIHCTGSCTFRRSKYLLTTHYTRCTALFVFAQSKVQALLLWIKYSIITLVFSDNSESTSEFCRRSQIAVAILSLAADCKWTLLLFLRRYLQQIRALRHWTSLLFKHTLCTLFKHTKPNSTCVEAQSTEETFLLARSSKRQIAVDIVYCN